MTAEDIVIRRISEFLEYYGYQIDEAVTLAREIHKRPKGREIYRSWLRNAPGSKARLLEYAKKRRNSDNASKALSGKDYIREEIAQYLGGLGFSKYIVGRVMKSKEVKETLGRGVEYAASSSLIVTARDLAQRFFEEHRDKEEAEAFNELVKKEGGLTPELIEAQALAAVAIPGGNINTKLLAGQKEERKPILYACHVMAVKDFLSTSGYKKEGIGKFAIFICNEQSCMSVWVRGDKDTFLKRVSRARLAYLKQYTPGAYNALKAVVKREVESGRYKSVIATLLRTAGVDDSKLKGLETSRLLLSNYTCYRLGDLYAKEQLLEMVDSYVPEVGRTVGVSAPAIEKVKVERKPAKQVEPLPLTDEQVADFVRTGSDSTLKGLLSGKAGFALTGEQHKAVSLSLSCAGKQTRTERMAKVVTRVNQADFRKMTLSIYPSCVVTGVSLKPTLEAAHIRAVKDGGEHSSDNCLALRSDWHALFDAHLWTIDPSSHQIILSDEMRAESEYASINGSVLKISASNEYITEHYQAFNEQQGK